MPNIPYIPRQLVRVVPFAAQKTFPTQALNNGVSLQAEFDVSLGVVDPGQLQSGGYPNGAQPPAAKGPFLDVAVFSVQSGTLTIQFAIDRGCQYRTVYSGVIGASAFSNVSGLRITGRFVLVVYANTSGVNSATCEFGAYVRSS